MEILFDNNTDFVIDDNTLNSIKKCVLETLNTENIVNNVEISLSIVDNKEIKEINFLHRNINKETDVLSFPLINDFDNMNNDLHIIPLGDIIISIEKAISQSEEYNHSLERELCFLTVHSMLHLLGYDHMTKEEEEIMFKKQDIILNNLNITR